MPKKISGGGRFSKDFLNRHGELRHIKSLRFWPLDKVLTEKYNMPDAEVRRPFLPTLVDRACADLPDHPVNGSGKLVQSLDSLWCGDDHQSFTC